MNVLQQASLYNRPPGCVLYMRLLTLGQLHTHCWRMLRGAEEICKKLILHKCAIMFFVFFSPPMRWNIPNENRHIWKRCRKNKPPCATGAVLPLLINGGSPPRPSCCMQIMLTDTQLKSLQALVYCNLNRKDRWGEGQLAFINHCGWQRESARRTEMNCSRGRK